MNDSVAAGGQWLLAGTRSRLTRSGSNREKTCDARAVVSGFWCYADREDSEARDGQFDIYLILAIYSSAFTRANND